MITAISDKFQYYDGILNNLERAKAENIRQEELAKEAASASTMPPSDNWLF